jgi:enolase
MIITDIIARKILNSRGDETIEVDVFHSKGFGRGSAPSGASTGTFEAIPFPKDVDYSVNFFNQKLKKSLIGMNFNNFNSLKKVEKIIEQFDSTSQKTKIGGNIVIALEFALLHALADKKKQPLWQVINPKSKNLPRPLGNAVGGGAHAGSNSIDIQEFLLLSLDSSTYSEALDANCKVHKIVKKRLQELDNSFTGGKTDEGAWCPNISNLEVLDMLSKVAKEVSKEFGFKIRLGLDMASSELFENGKYIYNKFSKDVPNKILTRSEQINFVIDLIKKYDLCYVEDPLNEDDFEGFAEIKKKASDCLICGDDLCVTNPSRLKTGIKKKSISAVIVKPNQVGSLVKTKEFIDLAKKNKITPVISHRSGETNDDTIAHLSVAFDIPVIKCGIVGGERLAKLNELLRIEESIKRS